MERESKWTQKRKDSIDCSNPKGFSQRAHCQSLKKKDTTESMTADASGAFDASFGARPLKRLIQREIADKAAIIILEGRVSEDGVIAVDVADGELVVTGR